MKEEAVCAGIDVSRDSLEVAARPGGASWKAQNSDEGIRELIKRLKEARVSLAVAEATGGFEVPMVSSLASHGVAVAVVNPRRVREFARATGRLAETDAIDAGVLAHFAEAVKPEARPLKEEEARDRPWWGGAGGCWRCSWPRGTASGRPRARASAGR